MEQIQITTQSNQIVNIKIENKKSFDIAKIIADNTRIIMNSFANKNTIFMYLVNSFNKCNIKVENLFTKYRIESTFVIVSVEVIE